eukprot:TRINITY_DN380_c1_g1_i5.p1 TRINITY_DN380_c1_g1~~TRINITY_DN380_c1_g1_i5.p1  ORF type:complete len:333 (+),score=76.31 TRINITY_DN380_c1_g1_i5:131-1129(+)
MSRSVSRSPSPPGGVPKESSGGSDLGSSPCRGDLGIATEDSSSLLHEDMISHSQGKNSSELSEAKDPLSGEGEGQEDDLKKDLSEDKEDKKAKERSSGVRMEEEEDEKTESSPYRHRSSRRSRSSDQDRHRTRSKTGSPVDRKTRSRTGSPRSRSSSRDRSRRSRKDRSSSPRRHRSGRHRSPQEDEDGYRIHVADLDVSASKRDMEKVFGKFGPLKEIWMARSVPCFAFCVFRYREDAEDAVRTSDGTEVSGRRIRVTHARPRTKGRGRRGFNPNMRCYQCGDRGHFSRDCPDTKYGYKRPPSPRYGRRGDSDRHYDRGYESRFESRRSRY